jgi:EAL domain-containing protein (putative c-di-GMP-specific phosphodiesterase class I)
VKTILTLAHGLGMQVVAEGTEADIEVNTLTDLGCDFAQGYFFSRPVGESEVYRLLRKQSEATHLPQKMGDNALSTSFIHF